MYNGSNWLLGEALSFASVWKLFKSLQQQKAGHTVYSSVTTFSFSSSLVSLVSPGLFWRARWCQMSPSQVPAMWRRRGRFLRRTTDDWRRETDSSSSARSQTHSPGVWLWWWNTGTQTAWTQSLKTYLVLCHFFVLLCGAERNSKAYSVLFLCLPQLLYIFMSLRYIQYNHIKHHILHTN